MTDRQLYIVEVDDQCDSRLVGHSGCSYTSPPQPGGQALALVRALLSCAQLALELDDAPWTAAIAGGRRVDPAAPRPRRRPAHDLTRTPRSFSQAVARPRSSWRSTVRRLSPVCAAISS